MGPGRNLVGLWNEAGCHSPVNASGVIKSQLVQVRLQQVHFHFE